MYKKISFLGITSPLGLSIHSDLLSFLTESRRIFFVRGSNLKQKSRRRRNSFTEVSIALDYQNNYVQKVYD